MKITFPIIGVAVLAGLILTIGFWTMEFTHLFNLGEHWAKEFVYELSHTFQISELRSIAIWSIAKGFGAAFGTVYLIHYLGSHDRRNDRFIRGARLVTWKELARKTRAKSNDSNLAQITIGGVPMPHVLEDIHLLAIGSTGKGKSTLLIGEILPTILQRGDRVIIIDANGSANKRHRRKGDTVLNPFAKESQCWSIFNEFRDPWDYQRFAKSVIPDSQDANTQEWHGYAQQLFGETTRALVMRGETTTEQLVMWLTQKPASELRELLIGTSAQGLCDADAAKAFASTRFILTKYLNSFQYLRDGTFSLRTWLEKGKGNLYITWNENNLRALKPLISAWTDILMSSVLSLPENQNRRIWLMLDELASLQRLESLEDGLTKGRKYGLRITAGLQSVSQLEDLYGVKKAATLRSCFLNMVVLGGSNCDPATAEIVAKGVGHHVVEREQISRSEGPNGRTVSRTLQLVTELLVSATDLMNLNPLEGYVKFAGAYPVAKINLHHRKVVVKHTNSAER